MRSAVAATARWSPKTKRTRTRNWMTCLSEESKYFPSFPLARDADSIRRLGNYEFIRTVLAMEKIAYQDYQVNKARPETRTVTP